MRMNISSGKDKLAYISIDYPFDDLLITMSKQFPVPYKMIPSH